MVDELKTVADFGVLESIRRAQDIEENEGVQHLVKEAATTASLTETPVVQPYNPPQLTELTGDPSRVIPYALFSSPTVKHSKSHLFSSDVSLAIGPVEKQEKQMEDIAPYIKLMQTENPSQKNQIEKEAETVQQTNNRLLSMGIDLRYVNNHRSCTQKG